MPNFSYYHVEIEKSETTKEVVVKGEVRNSSDKSYATVAVRIVLFMKNISVIGAGTMGNGIAHVFAQNGFKVTLIDESTPQLEKALATIAKNLDRQVAKEVITEAQKIETQMAKKIKEEKWKT